MMEAIEIKGEVELTKAEALAYGSWRSRNDPGLSPAFQAQLFELFLNGSSCEEIAKLNPGVSLGSIVAARVSGRWDERRDGHINKLLDTIRERVQQVTLETVEVVADTLAAANKLNSRRLKKFIQTGDPKDLGDAASITPSSVKQYREVAELLLKLTGQDGKHQKITGEIQHTVVPVPVPAAGAPVDGGKAAKILAILTGKE